ncbi:hypothetical protein MSS93_12450 [Deinococcus radiodurans]|nr:hypothetical protein MSS93_12450 [Deinococcus radiodurans]
MLSLTVLSTSLDPESRSAWLAALTARQLREAGHRVTHLDLRETPLGPFDNVQGPGGCYEHPNAGRTTTRLLGPTAFFWRRRSTTGAGVGHEGAD